MDLTNVKLKSEYRSLKDNIVEEFYIPALSESNCYMRSVGYFSSSALIEISKGISGLITNNGKIYLIASPFLSDEDIEAINYGYENRKSIILNSLFNSLNNHIEHFEIERLNLLAYLISSGVMEIKIAITEKAGIFGLYHEKIGIISDDKGNKIAFTGSMNETYSGMKINYESIDVFCSWKGEGDRVDLKEQAFSRIWNNAEKELLVMEFPELNSEIIKRYRKGSADLNIDSQQYPIGKANELCKNNRLRIPYDLIFEDFQLQAIKTWVNNNYIGIFDMATGTGKTYTALGALTELYKTTSSSLGIVIVCPFQSLIEQWVKDLKKFNVAPLICYSDYDWKSDFRALITDFNLGIISNFCLITTNQTFASENFQSRIEKCNNNLCLVVDEAHNFGAKKQLDCMKPIYKYRIALSATLDRHHDPIGTAKLYQFFGEKCIEYSINDAIAAGKLTPYFYYPILTYLDADEFEKYCALTEKILKNLEYLSEDEPLPKTIEMMLIKRARIVAGAKNKLVELKNIIKSKYLNDNNMLIYCGATNSQYETSDLEKISSEDKRQIEHVVDILGNELGMKVSKFTAEEDSEERESIKKDFEEGKFLQALIAIKCLDEGINIPGIKTAFILASSTNPKEYIQRRGRILRKSEGKDFATIYDFITLPSLANRSQYKNIQQKSEISLVLRELKRMEYFAETSENPSDVMSLRNRLIEEYGLNLIEVKEDAIY